VLPVRFTSIYELPPPSRLNWRTLGRTVAWFLYTLILLLAGFVFGAICRLPAS
jgi:hypothetical protein